jgi:8-hydroxy-5-deazaflavin:NADPH oxidoreductase
LAHFYDIASEECHMSHVSVIGGGSMNRAIATILTKGGNTVEVFDDDNADKPVTGDVVFLAVPYPVVADVLVQRGDQLAGKVVVGITKNPLNFETFDSHVVPADASAAAEIASSLPRSRTLKAFNTNSATPLASGALDELPTTVPIGDDDADAKSVLADIVARAGYAPSMPVRLPAQADWMLSASRRSPSPPPRSCCGPADSPSSPEGTPGWHRAPDEGSSRWWYLGMLVLVLTLLALLTLLYRA